MPAPVRHSAHDGDRALVLCTLRYSSNLGDGVIGDCLEYLVHRVQPGRTVSHLDMAGRTAFPVAHAAGEGRGDIARTVFYRCPIALRPLLTRLAWPLLFRPKLQNAWTQVRPGGPFDLIFGGGQMLSDLALNFPLKFAFVVELASAAQARMAVSAVGVSGKWSPAGRALFRKALSQPLMRSFGVRDSQSRDRLEAHVPALAGQVVVTVDPGIWAGEVYGLSRRAETSERLTIGLGVSEPAELAAYAHAADDFSEDAMLAYWSKLARILIEAEHRPVLFTNGSEDDEVFLDRLMAQLQSLGVTPDRLPRAVTPAALADHFRQLDALVSHRLHANIIAFSAGIPSVALVWDDKVRAFAQVAGREHWTLSAGANARQTADLVIEAARAGVDLERRDALKARALADVEIMLGKLEAHAA